MDTETYLPRFDSIWKMLHQSAGNEWQWSVVESSVPIDEIAAHIILLTEVEEILYVDGTVEESAGDSHIVRGDVLVFTPTRILAVQFEKDPRYAASVSVDVLPISAVREVRVSRVRAFSSEKAQNWPGQFKAELQLDRPLNGTEMLPLPRSVLSARDHYHRLADVIRSLPTA